MEKRKSLRLPKYDYSQNGVYFVTICTAKRKHTLGRVNVPDSNANVPNKFVGVAALGDPITLTQTGQIVKKYIENVNDKYAYIRVDKYVIMPNHIHLLICIQKSDDGSPRAATPTALPQIVNSLKGLASKEAGVMIWQRGYCEHIIRNERDYLEIWQYIDSNPYKWAEDEYNV